MLFFESFILTFVIHEHWEEKGDTNHSFCDVKVGGETVEGITTYDPKQLVSGKQLWLLLTRHIDGSVLFNMISSEKNGWCYERTGFLRLEVSKDTLCVLEGLGLHRLRGIMV